MEAFDSAWHKNTVPPSINAYLIQFSTEPELTALVELIRIDLEYRWRRAAYQTAAPTVNYDDKGADFPHRPYLEDYLSRFTQFGASEDLGADCIAEEYRVRHRWGDKPAHAEYFSRFPAVKDALAELLPAIDMDLAAEQRGTGEAAPPRLVTIPCPSCNQPISTAQTTLSMTCPSCGSKVTLQLIGPDDRGTGKRRVGRYELISELGAGAFGTVWRALDTELGREVAVKLPRHGRFDSPAQEERFLREARSSAQLQHPGVVAVHDVGRDSDTVFLVADLIHGVSLADWLKQNRIAFREAAEIAAQVADALRFAHERGVVHRDLKPSNVMLSFSREREGSGGFAMMEGSRLSDAVPRITDFGLAKRDAGEVTMTIEGQVLGTPAYMSPEQMRDPHSVDGRSDIYSLSVMLYEMLTGELPFRGVTRMVLQQVLEEEPIPPRRLNDKIPRDLETITLKCLAKEPARRYQSAGDLAAELRRWLAGEPVTARPAGRMERTWRWCRRKPAQAGMITTLIATVVALSGAAIWLDASRKSEQRARLEEEKQREAAQASEAKTQQARSEAEAVADFLVTAFRSPHPYVEGKDVKVVAILEKAVTQLNDDTSHSPATKARLLHALGDTFLGLGLPARAAEVLERARSLREDVHGPNDPATLDSMHKLGRAYRNAGRVKQALPLLEETFRRREATLGAEHVDTLNSIENLAGGYLQARRVQDGISLYEKVALIRKRRQGPDHDDTVSTLNNLATAYGEANRASEAIPVHQEVYQTVTAKLGGEHPWTLQAGHNLAAAYVETGRMQEGLALFEEVLRIRKLKLGPDHLETIYTMNDLAAWYRTAGRRADSRALYREALEVQRLKPAAECPELATTLLGLGSNLLKDNPAEAELCFRESLTHFKTEEPGQWRHLNVQMLLGISLSDQAKYEEAEPVLLGAFEGLTARESLMRTEAKPVIGEAWKAIVDLYERWGKSDKADEWRAKRPSASAPMKK